MSCVYWQFAFKPNEIISKMFKVRSQEVEMGEIFLLNIFNENGQVPSDILSDTKNSIRVVH